MSNERRATPWTPVRQKSSSALRAPPTALFLSAPAPQPWAGESERIAGSAPRTASFFENVGSDSRVFCMAMCAGGGPQQTSPGGTDEGSSGDAILSGGATAADVANGLSNGLAMPTATVQTDPSAESASVPGAAGQSAAAAGAATADGAAAATAAAAAAPPPGAAVAQGSNGEQAAVGEGSAAVAVGVAAGGSDQKAGGTPSAAAASSALNAPAAPLPPALAVQQSATVAAGAVAAAAAGGSGGASGAPAAAGQNEQRLEVAAAAVLVHAAGCKNPTCPVPHCNKMKKIHGHFLSCSTPDCGICKKLKPLTYIHAKHCVATPGEPCIIPYCNNAK